MALNKVYVLNSSQTLRHLSFQSIFRLKMTGKKFKQILCGEVSDVKIIGLHAVNIPNVPPM